MDIGFVRGKSDHLPRVDTTRMAMYFKENSDFLMAETRGIKTQRIARYSSMFSKMRSAEDKILIKILRKLGDICYDIMKKQVKSRDGESQ
ncbi:hypothetical protein AVEN_264997-1 [Araneus ventricosus]|uniref:Uncharacterized protein n=1 Tax=Araneus ventricosus TaxID=182803 RepID=A0A4Y2ENV7_ARAVE|nr:hypothetical protein AVEN_264997-1 [Araneus ventricosus]